MPKEDLKKLKALIIGKSIKPCVTKALEESSFDFNFSADLESAMHELSQSKFDLIVCDYQLCKANITQLFEKLHSAIPEPAVFALGEFDSSQMLELIKQGFADCLDINTDAQELKFFIMKALAQKQVKRVDTTSRRYSFSNIIAQSQSMKELFETVKRLADFNTTVLIQGESGTGKELLAKAIHQNSPRQGKPFIAINCGAIPENLMETELFGHKKGAFTDASRDKKGLFEEASGGTLFLDEIGEMSLHLQVKLLRALQEQQIRRVGDEELIKIDVRVIAATLRDLEKDVKNGRFREDLYYRLNVVSLPILPLRDRPDDIPVLVKHFVKKHSKRLGLSPKKVDAKALKQLMQYRWRGNVRELENCIERALVLAESDEIDCSALPEHILEAKNETGVAEQLKLADDNLSIKQHTRSLESELIKRALEHTKGNRTHAAKVLEISHRALLYKLKEYGLSDYSKKQA